MKGAVSHNSSGQAVTVRSTDPAHWEPRLEPALDRPRTHVRPSGSIPLGTSLGPSLSTLGSCLGSSCAPTAAQTLLCRSPDTDISQPTLRGPKLIREHSSEQLNSKYNCFEQADLPLFNPLYQTWAHRARCTVYQDCRTGRRWQQRAADIYSLICDQQEASKQEHKNSFASVLEYCQAWQIARPH